MRFCRNKTRTVLRPFGKTIRTLERRDLDRAGGEICERESWGEGRKEDTRRFHSELATGGEDKTMNSALVDGQEAQ